MKKRHFFSLAFSGFKAIINPRRAPVLATIILTNKCNLKCKHCAVADQGDDFTTYSETLDLMYKLYHEGTRILFFCGGEVFLWRDGDYDIHDLVKQAKKIGFFIVCLVTNGTISANVPEADLVFLSIDGMEKNHDLIRGNTFQAIMSNLRKVKQQNIVFYMAVNNINIEDITNVTALAKEMFPVKALSFNFHTPYSGTESLSLCQSQKRHAVAIIQKLIDDGAPIFNLPVGLKHYLSGSWSRPCYQCVVYDNGKPYVCGRCSEVPGLCKECGYLFAVEFALLLDGNFQAIHEMLSTYLKYC